MDCEYEVVTRANEVGASAFLTIGRDYLAYIMPDRSTDHHEMYLGSMLDRQREPDRWLLLMKHGGDPIGFTHAKIDRDERLGLGYILEFYIIPSARRRGMGTLLYEHIAGIFRSRGLGRVWLSADPRAEQFWQSLGFSENGEFEGHQKIMIAELT